MLLASAQTTAQETCSVTASNSALRRPILSSVTRIHLSQLHCHHNDSKLYTHLIAKTINISQAKFHCNRLTTAQEIQHYASHFWDSVVRCARKLACLCGSRKVVALCDWLTIHSASYCKHSHCLSCVCLECQ